MPELLKDNKRVVFPPGSQFDFLLRAVNKLDISWSSFAKRISVHPRTLNDWKREKYSLPFTIFEKICVDFMIKKPTGIEVRKPYWWTGEGGRIAGKLVFKKYGRIGGNNEDYRKKKWYEWWERRGKFVNKSVFFEKKPIKKPDKNVDLAEFVGIMIGDGGITNRQITISLGARNDREYGIFVKSLIKKLFGVEPSVYFRKDKLVMNIVVSRILLVDFCVSIGLKRGDKLKQDLDIPKWIMKKKDFKIACLRGLMDTDGCVFNECHIIKNKKYCYLKTAFVSFSGSLRFSVDKILKELGFSPKIRNNRSVKIEKRNEVIKYFQIVGTNNPKHNKRFASFLGGVG